MNDGINTLLKMFEKSAIFIDGGYFNRLLKKFFGGAQFDYLRFSKRLGELTGTAVLRTHYYTCMPIKRQGNEKDKERHANMQRFITKLHRLPRFSVKRGRLQFINGVFKQKMVDVHMSLDLVDMSFDNQIQHAIIVAGDSDFIPAIERAKNHGTIVHLFYHPDTVHHQLLDMVDELHVIDESLIASCKMD